MILNCCHRCYCETHSQEYITGPSSKPFVLYGAAGSGKSALLSKTALQSLKVWLSPAVPLLMCRYCGTTPNSTALGPLLKSICQQEQLSKLY